MSGKLRPRVKPTRVKLTRASQTRSELRFREESSDYRHDRVATEPDCSEAVLLDSLEEGVQKNGERLRNLSMCLDGTLHLKPGRKSWRNQCTGNEYRPGGIASNAERFRKQHTNSSQTRPVSIPSRSTDDFGEAIAGLGASGLSFALQREERRADQLCAAFQAIGPVVTEIAERLRRKEEKKKLEEELAIAKETISELSKDVEQLTNEVKLLSSRNVSLLESTSYLKSSFESALLLLSSAVEEKYSQLLGLLVAVESRLNAIETRITASLREMLINICEATDISKEKAEEAIKLHDEISRLSGLLEQAQSYSAQQLSRLEDENDKLREENDTLSSNAAKMQTVNEHLVRRIEETQNLEAVAAANVLLSQELEKSGEELVSAQSLLRVQSVELRELRKEIADLSDRSSQQHLCEISLHSELHRLRLEITEMQSAYAAFEDELRSDSLRSTFQMVNEQKLILADQRRKSQSVDIDSVGSIRPGKRVVLVEPPVMYEGESDEWSEGSDLYDYKKEESLSNIEKLPDITHSNRDGTTNLKDNLKSLYEKLTDLDEENTKITEELRTKAVECAKLRRTHTEIEMDLLACLSDAAGISAITDRCTFAGYLRDTGRAGTQVKELASRLGMSAEELMNYVERRLTPGNIRMDTQAGISILQLRNGAEGNVSLENRHRQEHSLDASFQDEALEIFDPAPETVVTTFAHGQQSWTLLKSQKSGYFWRAVDKQEDESRRKHAAIVLQRIGKMVKEQVPECEDVLEGVEIVLRRVMLAEGRKRVEKPLFGSSVDDRQLTPIAFPKASALQPDIELDDPPRRNPLESAVFSLLCELPPLSKDAESAISRVLAELQAPDEAVKRVEQARSSKSSPTAPGLSRIAAW